MTLDDIIREAILEAIDRNGGNKVAAAKELGIGKTTVYRLLKQYETRRRKRAQSRLKKRKKRRN